MPIENLHLLKRRAGAILVALAVVASPAAAAPAEAATPVGRWLTASGNVEVEIAPCGRALCGVIVRVLANRSMAPGGGDMKPADARPALGMMILKDFRPDDEGRPDDDPSRGVASWSGQIYNRENGKTYSCLMSVDQAGRLVVHPYVGLPLFGRQQLWQRVSGPALESAR